MINFQDKIEKFWNRILGLKDLKIKIQNKFLKKKINELKN